MVIATQNPIEMEGTYALPEAQRDRFMARVSVGYPVEAAEIAMLNSHTTANPLDDLEPVTDAGEIRKLTEIVGQVHVSTAVQRYAVALTTATRHSRRAPPRRLAARHPAPRARGQGRGRHGGSRLRPARRRPRARPSGARPPPAAQRRVVDERSHAPPRSWKASWPGCRSPKPAVREALAGLTVRGRVFLAAGVTTIVCAIIVGQSPLVRIGVLVTALPLLAAAVDRSLALPPRADPHRLPPARRRRPVRPGPAHPHQRGPHPDRRAAARGPPALCPGHPPPLRAGGHRPRVAPARDLPGPLRCPRPVRDRPDVRARHRPLRADRARARLPHHRAADRHPAHRCPARHPDRRRLDRLGRQPPARLRHRQRRGRHRPRIPPRRRPAARALAQLGPGRRADGPARGTALAVARHRLPRQPAHLPPRPGRRLVARGGRLRRGVGRRPPEPARVRRTPGHRIGRGPGHGVALRGRPP